MTKGKNSRRWFLSVVGALATTGLAGCLSRAGTGTPTGTAPGNENSTNQPSSAATDRAGAEGTDPCPPAPFDDEIAVRCGGDSSMGDVRMTVSEPTLAMPQDQLTVTLSNESDATLESSPKHYQFYHRRDDEWVPIYQKVMTAEAVFIDIPPGEEYQWRIELDTADLGPRFPPQEKFGYRYFLFRLPPGRYAFGYRFRRMDQRVMYTREFEVTGDPLQLIPSDAVIGTSSGDGTLTVRVEPDYESENDRRVSLIADRLPDVPESATELTLFELYNPGYRMVRDIDDRTRESPLLDGRLARLLRDGFAHYEGSADRIRVETEASAVPPLGIGSEESSAVTYDTTAWRLDAENGWDR